MPKGYKTCPQCQENNGPRSFTCKKCNYDFLKTKRAAPPPAVVKKEEPVTPSPPLLNTKQPEAGWGQVETPAGACPPCGESADEVRQWVDKRQSEKSYSATALKYWLRMKYGEESEQMKHLRALLHECKGETTIAEAIEFLKTLPQNMRCHFEAKKELYG